MAIEATGDFPKKGKTPTAYVPMDLTDEVAASRREHQRLNRVLREITQLQVALIRS